MLLSAPVRYTWYVLYRAAVKVRVVDGFRNKDSDYLRINVEKASLVL